MGTLTQPGGAMPPPSEAFVGSLLTTGRRTYHRLRTPLPTDNGRTGPLVRPEMAFRNFENDPFHHLIRKEETERFGIVLSSVKGSFLSQNELMI